MKKRDLRLDFVKGVLVIVMVFYHTMNYFIVGYDIVYTIIGFVSGSFLFISGFLIGYSYKPKFFLDKYGVVKRLIIRGFKILLLFTILNLLIHLLVKKNYNNTKFGIDIFINNLYSIYVVGSGKVSSFEILVPIAYVLIISPLFLFLKQIKHFLLILITIIVIIQAFYPIVTDSLSFVLIGLSGECIGLFTSEDVLKKLIRYKYINLGFLSAVIFIIIFLKINLIIYVIYIISMLKFFYDFPVKIKSDVPSPVITLLGKYSLFCYISQIIFLQILNRIIINKKFDLGYEFIIIFFITNIFLYFLCKKIEFLRNQLPFMNKLYKLAFA